MVLAPVITTGGFSLINLGNNGSGVSGKDSLHGAATTSSHNFSAPGSFVALLNPLTFSTGSVSWDLGLAGVAAKLRRRRRLRRVLKVARASRP